jgi:hypothetical protein
MPRDSSKSRSRSNKRNKRDYHNSSDSGSSIKRKGKHEKSRGETRKGFNI